MDPLIGILCFVGGLAAGGFGSWLLSRSQIAAREAAARADLGTQLAGVQAALQERTLRLEEVASQAARFEQSWQEAQSHLQKETEARSTAEQSVVHLQQN